jgi:hypothetical protein
MKQPKLADVCGQRIDIAQMTPMTFADDNLGNRNSSHTNPSCADKRPRGSPSLSLEALALLGLRLSAR